MIVTLYHATTRAAAPDCWRQGILTRMAKGAMRAVWLVPENRVHWAILHTQKRHGVSLDDVRVISVKIDSSRVKSHGGGRHYTLQDIEPVDLEYIYDGEWFAS